MSFQKKHTNSNSLARFVSAKDAAKKLKCAPDYVGKLCREGVLTGVQVERVWYIDPASIAVFELQRAEAKVVRSRELAELRRKESQESATIPPRKVALNRFVFSNSLAIGTIAVFFLLVLSTGAHTVMQRSIGVESASGLAITASIAQVDSPFFGTQKRPQKRKLILLPHLHRRKFIRKQ
jgi:hypothetical protein